MDFVEAPDSAHSPKRSEAAQSSIQSSISDGDVSVRETEEKGIEDESKKETTTALSSNSAPSSQAVQQSSGLSHSVSEASGKEAMGEEDDHDIDGTQTASGKQRVSQKAVEFFGYENEEQLLRSKALQRMGLTEDDMYKAAPHFKSSDQQLKARETYHKKGYTDKLPALTGMTEEQIMRRKAVDTLGTDEDSIDMERVARLANLGISDPKVNSCTATDDSNCLS